MTKFQLILTGIFVLCIVAGAAAFALFRGSSTSTQLPAITIWGTLPSATVDQFISNVNSSLSTAVSVTYVQVDEASFNQSFVQAIAKGQGPDAILIPQEMVVANEPEILPIPYTVLPERTFLDTYIQEADLYLRSDGIDALPFSVDPLVMYWNRDTFNAAGIASAGTMATPIAWSTLASYAPKINLEDTNSNIQKSLVALGQFANIDNAREIFGSILMQAGNPVTLRAADNSIYSAIGNGQFQGLNSATAATSFFTRFANPTDAYYSWNASLPDSQTFFLDGNLATYFGFASELATIRTKNPNLNFDVAPFPQATGEKTEVTYGRMYGFSLVKSSAKSAAAYTILQYLTTPAALAQWSTLATLPPVRNDMITSGTTDPYMTMFYKAALVSEDWLDPNPQGTATIFQNMVESIESGAATETTAIQNASGQINGEISGN
jgi:ABC-type glycerol-3-phosphate transport system substrate-binding protein